MDSFEQVVAEILWREGLLDSNFGKDRTDERRKAGNRNTLISELGATVNGT
jgi:hypothetical protein